MPLYDKITGQNLESNMEIESREDSDEGSDEEEGDGEDTETPKKK